ISASDTPKSRLDTSSFPPVSTPAPPPKPLSKRSCCHLSGSCFGCGGRRPPGPPPAPPRAPARRPAAPLTLLAGRFRMGPPPRLTRAAACAPLMMSSRDMSILSAMAGAESASARARASARRRVTSGAARGLPGPRPGPPGIGRGGRERGRAGRAGAGARAPDGGLGGRS
uniref:Uncharacterized protein n=3 Tax=Canis lupus TaxID=9612 RepID=A0A8C0NSM4_CANLF